MLLATSIRTARLILQPLDPATITDRYVHWLNDPRVNSHLEVRLLTQTLDRVRAFVCAQNESSDSLLLGIFLGATGGEHIGNIKLGPIIEAHRRGDVGLLIGATAHWGKGYATEAIATLTDYAHRTLGLTKVTAGIYASNVGSQRAFLKAGFIQEARLKSHWLRGHEWDDQLLFAHFSEGR